MASDAPQLPPTGTLPMLPIEARASVLDLLFEPSPALHSLVLPLIAHSFDSYEALITATEKALLALSSSSAEADQQSLEDVLSSHPRLGEKQVDSALSRMEQAAMAKASQASATNEADETQKQQEAEQLKALNAAYEEKFPGLRYVVFVNGRSRAVIMENMRQRINRGDIEAERKEAILAMCQIAADRVAKLQC